MSASLENLLVRISEDSDSAVEKGRRFEGIMRRALEQHPTYRQRFSAVQTYAEWARARGESPRDLGIDLVAALRDSDRYAAIQCKFYRPQATLELDQIDRFLAASGREIFSEGYFIWTGGEARPSVQRRLDENYHFCRYINRAELADWDLNWDELYDHPEALRYGEPHRPRPHQERAIAACQEGFAEHDRGQLILPCGTGKTAATLWLAERQVGLGGRVLYLVPSLALVAQAMREWAQHGRLRHRYLAVCSDITVAREREDDLHFALAELAIPPTTETARIGAALRREAAAALTVVFSTYQSLERIAEAQDGGAPAFDLVICDEAHRTTGVEKGEDEGRSPFTLVHDEGRIRARKRLYTTATPRLYNAASKTRAQSAERALYSMDDEGVYGPEFHRLNFGQAIDQGLLADYRVSVLCISREKMARQLAVLQEGGLTLDVGDSTINVDDVARIIGCWDALADPEGRLRTRGTSGAIGANPCTTALAFANTIRNSKNFRAGWEAVVPRYAALQRRQLGADEGLLAAKVEHVDGTDSSVKRRERLRWLEEATGEHDYGPQGLRAHILSNARCLTEGVDVPALDAILFIAPRRSTVDIVQAVGRVMRQARGKEYGYIILPVVVTEEQDSERALEDSAFQMVWDVLSALRSHDDRLDAEASLDLREKLKERIKIWPADGKGEGDGSAEDEVVEEPAVRQMLLQLADIPPGLLYAKIVERVGDREYLPKWSERTAEIYEDLCARLRETIARAEAAAIEDGGPSSFTALIEQLRATINPTLGAEQAIALLAQHLITRPVFAALSGPEAVRANPVTRDLDDLLEDLLGSVHSPEELRPFYRRIGTYLAQASPKQKQEAQLRLYENFFHAAMPKQAQRLGIFYTPAPVVDYLLYSADFALQEHFGKRLCDPGVRIIDPFAGTGNFLVRLIENEELMPKEALPQKFHNDLWANEILLLAYHMADFNITQAYRARGHEAVGFPGAVWTDTFQLHEHHTGKKGQQALPLGVSAENTARAQRQNKTPLTVIFSNPPYRGGQKSADDDNPNIVYPRLYQRIADTYAARSDANNKKSLYDSYKIAIRWATDRMEDERGALCFITSAGYIDGNADSGIRACLRDEFAAAYVFNLRGAVLKGKAEGGNIFDIRQPVALTVLIKDAAHEGPCQIHYYETPDFLTRSDKFDLLEELRHVGQTHYCSIFPNQQHQWLNQRDEAFDDFLPLGNPETKAGKAENAIFRLYAPGIVTNRDPWMYNFSRARLAEKTGAMVEYYEERLEQFSWGEITHKEACKPAPKKIKWTVGLRDKLQRKKMSPHSELYIRAANHRPFILQNFYYDPFYAERPGRLPRMYPPPVALSPSSRGLAETPIQDNPTTSPSASTDGAPTNPPPSSPTNHRTSSSSSMTKSSPDTPTDPSQPTNSSDLSDSTSLGPPPEFLHLHQRPREQHPPNLHLHQRPTTGLPGPLQRPSLPSLPLSRGSAAVAPRAALSPETSPYVSTPQQQQNPIASSPISSLTCTSSLPEPKSSPDTPTVPSQTTNSSGLTDNSSSPPPQFMHLHQRPRDGNPPNLRLYQRSTTLPGPAQQDPSLLALPLHRSSTAATPPRGALSSKTSPFASQEQEHRTSSSPTESSTSMPSPQVHNSSPDTPTDSSQPTASSQQNDSSSLTPPPEFLHLCQRTRDGRPPNLRLHRRPPANQLRPSQQDSSLPTLPLHRNPAAATPPREALSLEISPSAFQEQGHRSPPPSSLTESWITTPSPQEHKSSPDTSTNPSRPINSSGKGIDYIVNLCICLHEDGPTSPNEFSALMTQLVFDRHLIHGGQGFPRYTYRALDRDARLRLG